MLGPTGVGKSFVASALAQKACRDGYSVFYARAQSLFRDLALARADGSLRHLLAKLGRIDVMVIDDWAMAPLAESERRDFWEICEERYQRRSTVLTSQLPISRWHEQIGDPTLADGILDRLVHNAHRIEMKGDSMRKRGNRSADSALRGLSVLRRGKGLAALSPHPFPRTAIQPPLRSGKLRDTKSLTKPNTSRTIKKPASLRSDSVRHYPGIPFGFPPEWRSPSPESAPYSSIRPDPFSVQLPPIVAIGYRGSYTNSIKRFSI